MSPESQRIAIAEAVGWVRQPDQSIVWERTKIPFAATWKKGFTCFADTLPRYESDLNAMHEAVLTLKAKDRRWFSNHLVEISGGNFEAHTATAAQRAEAFLKTIGKWAPEKMSSS